MNSRHTAEDLRARADVVRVSGDIHMIKGPGGSRYPYCNASGWDRQRDRRTVSGRWGITFNHRECKDFTQRTARKSFVNPVMTQSGHPCPLPTNVGNNYRLIFINSASISSLVIITFEFAWYARCVVIRFTNSRERSTFDISSAPGERVPLRPSAG